MRREGNARRERRERARARREERERKALQEEGRRLASQRDDLIAQGVDPADLIEPVWPETP